MLIRKSSTSPVPTNELRPSSQKRNYCEIAFQVISSKGAALRLVAINGALLAVLKGRARQKKTSRYDEI
jgi:hypothetical protein